MGRQRLRSSDIGARAETTFAYNVLVPRRAGFVNATVKVALAWSSAIFPRRIHHNISIFGSSVLLVDLDLLVYDGNGNVVARACSWDNSYEIAEFRARPGEAYTVRIRRFSGTADVQYGIAWNTFFAAIAGEADDLQRARASIA